MFELNSEFLNIKNKISEIKKNNILRQEKEKELKETQEIIKGIEVKLKEDKNHVERIADYYNIEVQTLDEKLFFKLMECNEQESSKIRTKINKLTVNNKKITDIYNERNKLIISEKSIYQDAIREKNFKVKKIEVEMNKISEILSLYKYDNQIVKITVNDFFNKLQDNILLEIQELESKEFIKETRTLQTQLYRAYMQQQEIIADVFTEIKEIQEYINVIEESVKLLKDSEKLDLKIQNSEDEIENLNETRRNLRENQRIETNKEIGKMASRISMIFEILSDVSPWKTIKSDAIVPGTRERTNLIFRPIPHKYVKNQKDYIENTKSNSTFAFSGGQLSLLGLSIFLSQVADAHSSNESILDTIILDDPIQMLDTLRDDALISLICDIAQEKQIIISTSDINFANKLILASRPIWEFEDDSCGVLYFDKIEEDGPIIKEYNPEKWINDQRIYLPKFTKASS